LHPTAGISEPTRKFNVGQAVHTMHLHGYHFEIVARDGYRPPSP
jgi:FtsP/CotA-like multicopper oxidase with cupredoxin domain